MAVEKKSGLISLKLLMKKLQSHLHPDVLDCEGVEGVPEDVKEGHFAIFAKNEEEKPIRFVVELCVLKHPPFLRLLKLAEEEYGFQHRGALQVPCQPEELRRILGERMYR